jgi:hypothetical protein
MTTPTPDVRYVLGDTGAEHERLIRQAAIFDPFTERLFRDAGVGRVSASWTSRPVSATSRCSRPDWSAHGNGRGRRA